MPFFSGKSPALRSFCFSVLALLLLAALPSWGQTTSTTVVISQVYGGGGGTGATANYLYNQDYVELFNLGTTTVDISGWSVQYMSAAGTSVSAANVLAIPSSTTLAPGQYYLLAGNSSSGSATYSGASLPVTPDVTAAVGSFQIAGGGGKVFLVNNSTALASSCTGSSIVDYIGQGTSASCYQGSGAAPTPAATSADVRTVVCTNTGNNASDFSVSTSAVPHASGTTKAPCGAAATPPTLTAAIAPSSVAVGGSVLLTATPTKGTSGTFASVTVDTSAITGGSTTQTLYDDKTHGDVTASDGTYSFTLAIPATQTAKTYTFTFTVTDGGGLTATATASLTVSATAIVPATTIAVVASPTTAVSGTTIGLAATVSGNGSSKPTGSVNFYDNTVLLGAGTSGGAGVFTYNATTLGVGSHSITASYSGDTNYPTPVVAATTCSATVTTNCDTPATVTITAPPTPDFTVNVSNNNIILNDDQKTTIATVAVAFLNGFNSTVSLKCSGLPSGSRCAFSPASFSASGNSAMTIAVDGASLAPHNKPFSKGSETVLAFGLLALPFALRRKVRARLGMAGTMLGLLILGGVLFTATGCGSTATPASTSTITVTATGGSITHTAGFTLTVQ